MNVVSRIPPAATAAIVVTIGACTTADYDKPIGDFAATTRDAARALDQLDTQVTETYAAIVRRRALAGRVFVRRKSGDCLVTSGRCRLVVVDREGKEEALSPDPALAQMVLVMRRIGVYAENLRALLDADTAATVAARVNAALGSVQSLAETVARIRAGGGGEAAEVADFATPVGAAANWLVGQYVARVKLRGLRRATGAAQPVIRDATALFETTAGVVADVPKAALAEDVSKSMDAFRSDRSDGRLDRLLRSAAAYDRLLLSRPPVLFKRLREAHDLLADKLNGEPVSFASLTARMQDFADQAGQLAKILKDLTDLAAKMREE